ncbi:GntR family transcriptional regulator [Lentilactobacillus sp. SPB1-3]|uniref:GntR family transcriptional regulator n=1 Tax=Lentilactobacillus terminaliae TaxID=3003483 RepID=A0ACD5DF66_9LACO|nr:GntR family transcriptional regulator [Lentilactobacillus sp. SPB1-3]MCZ0977577.1 GntR family transcriptional regulator [Lentilactobacillus sp. SPB1-3]
METKYSKVKSGLKHDIVNSQYAIHDKLPTESELMSRFDVSRYTIRRAMGDLEHEGYIERIQGGGMYVADWINKDKNTKLKRTIGVVTTHIADYIFPNIISGIDQVVSDEGMSVLIGNTHDQHDKERQSLINMLDNDVAGFIVEPTQSTLDNPNLDVYKTIQEAGKPVVFINSHYDELSAPYVELNDEIAERQLVEYLLDNGHEKVMGIYQVDDRQGVNRMSGFVKAYQNRPNIASLGDIMMYRSNDDIDAVLKQVKERISSESSSVPTAIACYNDELAIEVLGLLSNMGISVPDEISVVGFDDYELSKHINPSLTTMAHPKREMGVVAAKLLLSMINKEEVKPNILDAELVERNSVKKIEVDK